MKCRHGNNGGRMLKRRKASVHPVRSYLHSSRRTEDLSYLGSRVPLLPFCSGLRTYGFRNGIPFHFVIHLGHITQSTLHPFFAITNVELDKDSLAIDAVALGYVSKSPCKMIQVRLVDVQYPLLFPSKSTIHPVCQHRPAVIASTDLTFIFLLGS